MNELLMANMGNFLIGNPNQYVFQNPNDIFQNPSQENFFFNNGSMPQLDYNLMSSFQPNFMGAQPQFAPNDFLSQNNLMLANNNLMMPNNLSLSSLNGILTEIFFLLLINKLIYRF